MNHLQHESSPYLRQHAANPVDWYPWGAEALARAREENKPILLSIGYSTCHWCHVMERESFEDPTVSTIMNDYFVNIKVDREERPDLDQLYMEACQALTGRGGWPLNVFLTPELRPFHAGTYFPPTPGRRRPSWLEALEYAAYNFYENREAVERQADRTLAALASAEKKLTELVLTGPETEDPFGPDLPAAIYEALRKKFDPEAGGFDRAPKFPNTMALEFLLHYYWYAGSEEALQHAAFSIDRMLAGGVFDQLGGGLFRYSTDREWRVPHFEKMLYDNALFASLLADAYRLTRRADYRDALEQTLGFVERELTREEGGVYAALDADTEGEEGRFYTWTLPEVREVLGEEADLAAAWFDISEKGNWEGKSILRRRKSPEDFAEAHGETKENLHIRLEGIRRQLFAEREKRSRPHRDEKILLNWNALMVTAYAKAAAVLDTETYRAKAVRQLDFLLATFLKEDRALLHSLAAGKVRFAAYLNDYAFLIEALLEVYAVAFEEKYLHLAKELTKAVMEQFYDPEDHLFFTGGHSTDLLLRRKEVYDAEMPSGSAAMVRNLQRLGLLFDRPDWRKAAGDALLAMHRTVREDPLPFAHWATNLLEESYGYSEIAIVGDQAGAMARELQREFLPAHVLMAATEARGDFPLLRDRRGGEETCLYLCRDYACRQPVRTVGELREMLKDQGS